MKNEACSEVFEMIDFEILNLCTCFRCKSLCITTKTRTQIQDFKRNYLENYNDSKHAVKTKFAPFFIIFSNVLFFHDLKAKIQKTLCITTKTCTQIQKFKLNYLEN